MVASLRALLGGVIDYAGLFPPAALPLDQAVRNYARYRQEPESWMLGRFICPAAQLGKVELLLPLFVSGGSPVCFSILAGGGNEAGEIHAQLQSDLRSIAWTETECQRKLCADVLEIRLPPDAGDADASFRVRSLPATLAVLIHNDAGHGFARFFECSLRERWQAEVTRLVGEIRKQNSRERPEDLYSGLKLRCGGLNAAAFPSCEQVAFVIAACRDARVPLKFTAGLHHPLRHYNAGLQTHMHGFINVFVAGVLAHARGLSEEQLRPILEDEDAASFAFDDAGLRWKDHRATTDEITAARQMVTSFGSCSFDEPRDDLRRLGWLS